ncbi:MAG: hypothetical protein ACLQDC_03645 [Verrucomicrobiia bacterium]
MRLRTVLLLVGLPLGLAALGFAIQNTGERGLIVHEWGTFTSLQDENGQAIGGINTDDEPVPGFVHDLAQTLLIRATELPPVLLNKGAPGCHPDVTMRLETPVIYFHLPKPQTKPLTLDVNVEFRGGWLTQFYPSAEGVAPGVESGPSFGHLRSDTLGQLKWPALTVGSAANGPTTTAHVWTSPRAVDAASVTTTNGESEKFLFYRGVAHIDAPLQVARNSKGDQLSIRDNLDPALHRKLPLVIRHLWLTEVRPDGSSAYRRLDPVTMTGESNDSRSGTSATFAAADFSPQNAARFRADMHRALTEEGLFDDEADALLNTWELSYFKSAGLRLFFIVPRAWTDYYLPLQISVPAEVTRVMMGRIELVTPAQRALLGKIAAGPAPDMQSFQLALDAPSKPGSNQDPYNSVLAGSAPLASLGLPIPEIYQDYLDLGRFRNALLLDEQARRPTGALRDFIDKNGLKAYQIPAK